MTDKPIYWIGSSKEDITNFPTEARRKAGFQLRTLQKGQLPSDFKSMSIIGQGVEEIRIRTENAYRVFYIAKFSEAIYVLHAFQKTTQKTAKKDIQIGQQRYKQLISYRQERQI
jgi:phage-related protein